MSAPHPSFLDNVSSIWAHAGKAPYTATFEHAIPGPAHRVRSECLWYPPRLPASPTVSPPPSETKAEAAEGDRTKLFIETDTAKAPGARGMRGTSSGEGPAVCILLFIPGNPGIVYFYTEFLNAIHDAYPSLGILAKSHLGHTPHLNNWDVQGGPGPGMSIHAAGLEAQVESAIEVYDALVREYEGVMGELKIVLAGHSVGNWIITQIMKARPEAVDGAFMLFPAVCDLAQTPNGRRLRPLFFFVSAYILTAVVAVLFAYLFPAPLTMRLCEALFPVFPRSQLYVLRSLICSPRAVFSALRMARDEMRIIKGIRDLPSYDDPPMAEGGVGGTGSGTNGEKEESWGMGEGGAVADVLRANAKGIWVYFAESDNWVGEKGRVEIYRALKEGGGAFHEGVGKGSGEVVFGSDGVPHDFCINHDAIIAQYCIRWLRDGGFIKYIESQ